MIKSIEGFFVTFFTALTLMLSFVASCLGIINVIDTAIDVLTGDVFSAVSSIFNITYIAGYDLTLFDSGYQTCEDLLGYLNEYLPFQDVVNGVSYVLSVEVTIITARGLIGIYKLIPLKAT